MIRYELRGRPSQASSTWRITYKQNAIKHGWQHKMGRGITAGEIPLIICALQGARGSHRDDARRRKALWRARSRLEALMDQAGRAVLQQHIPITINFDDQEERASPPGYLAKKIDRELARLAEACVPEGRETRLPPKDPKRYGTRTWMGRAVPHLDDAPPPPSAPEEAATKRRRVAVVKPHWPVTEGHGGVRPLPSQGLPCVGAALGMAGIECYEGEGRLVDVECVIQRPGSGRLLVTGNVSPEVERCAHLSLCFLRLHSEWVRERFGPFRGLTPGDADADVRVHLCMTNHHKTGTSFGAALIVALAAAHLGCGVGARIAVSGRVNLLGPLGQVARLQQKLKAVHTYFKKYHRSQGQGGGEAAPLVRGVLPAENVRGEGVRSWELMEPLDLFSGHMAVPVELERASLKNMQVVPAHSVFELLTLCLVPVGSPQALAAAAAIAPPAELPRGLAVAHSVSTDDEDGSGALPQAVECALLRPGTGGCTYYSSGAQTLEAEAIDVVLYWLKASWPTIAQAWTTATSRPVAHDPTVLDYQLHVHLPALQRDARIAMAAGVALLSLFLGVPVPLGVTLIGEVQLTGRILPEATPHMHAALLTSAKLNQRLWVVVSVEAARELQRVLDRRQAATLEGVSVLGVRDMMEVFTHIFLQQYQQQQQQAGEG